MKTPLRKPSESSVKITGYVDALGLEGALKSFYTWSKSASAMVFDLSRLTRIDPLALTILILWLSELFARRCEVTIIWPAERSVETLLGNCGFENFVRYSAELRSESGYIRPHVPAEHISAPYPIQFLNRAELQELLKDLAVQGRLETVFSDVSSSSTVADGSLRDVLISELGDNLIRYADKSFGHVFALKLNQLEQQSSATDILGRFRSRVACDVLVLVVSDKGPGIPRTLRRSYCDRHEGEPPSACDILNWSFEYNSTSRTAGERLGIIRTALTDTQLKFPPATGLFRVRELIRQLFGVLYVRSGTGLLAYDFGTNFKNSRPTFRSDARKGTKRLTAFGGTQIVVGIPLKVPHQREATINRTAAAPLTHLQYIRVQEIADRHRSEIGLDEAALLDEFQWDLKRALAVSECDAVVIDLTHTEELLTPRAAHYLIYKIAERPRDAHHIVIVGISDLLALQVSEVFHSPPAGVWPFVAFNELGESRLLVGSADHNRVWIKVNQGHRLSAEDELVARRNPSVFEWSSLRSSWGSRFTYQQLAGRLRIVLQAHLKRLLTAAQQQIYDPHAKVLLPSQVYSRGFHHVTAITTSTALCSAVVDWWYWTLIDLQPASVVSLGSVCSSVVERLLRRLPASFRPRHHVQLTTGGPQILSTAALLDIPAKSKVVVFCDVVASAKTAKLALSHLSNREVLAVVAIVDATSDHEEQLPHALVSGWRNPTITSSELPRDWLYDEVCQVDPPTLALVPPPRARDRVLWLPYAFRHLEGEPRHQVAAHSQLLLEMIIPARAFRRGHFVEHGRHYTDVLDLAPVVEDNLSFLAQTIEQDARSRVKLASATTFTHVLYRRDARSVAKLSNSIAAAFRGCHPLAVAPDELKAAFEGPSTEAYRMDAVIVLESVIDSGGTAIKLIDVAERRGAKIILAYNILRRGPASVVHQLQKVTRYGHADLYTAVLAEVDLPSYRAHNCPVCRRGEAWQRARSRFAPNEGRAIEPKLAALEPQPFSAALSSSPPDDGDCLDIEMRWRAELAKTLVSERARLRDLLRRRSERPAESLSLLRILGYDVPYLSLDPDLAHIVLYKTLLEEITSATRDFLSEPDSFSLTDLEALLTVADEYCPGVLLDTYPHLVRHCTGERLQHLLLYSLVSPSLREHPRVAMNAFLQGSSTAEQGLLDALHNYFNGIEKTTMTQANERLQCYLTLRSDILHDLEHRLTRITSVRRRRNVPPRTLLGAWSDVEERVREVQVALRRLTASIMTHPNVSTLIEINATLSTNLAAGRKAVDVHTAGANDFATFAADMVGTAGAIRVQSQRLERHLAKLSCAFKPLVHDVLQQHIYDLDRHSIKRHINFLPGECQVFGEEVSIRSIVANLIDNVWSKSKARNMRLDLTADMQSMTASLVIRDDGVGLRPEMRHGTGLRDVAAFATSNGGEFQIVRNSVRMDDVEYVTAAHVTLAMLPPITE
jgi:signal transduction histidine kinase